MSIYAASRSRIFSRQPGSVSLQGAKYPLMACLYKMYLILTTDYHPTSRSPWRELTSTWQPTFRSLPCWQTESRRMCNHRNQEPYSFRVWDALRKDANRSLLRAPNRAYLGDAAKLLYQGFGMSLRSPSIWNLGTSGASDCGTRLWSANLLGLKSASRSSHSAQAVHHPIDGVKDCFSQK